MHTAPAHGADDFYTGVKYGLDLHCNVDDAGILHNGLPEYEGKQVFKANPPIVELLKSRGVLLGYEKIEHSYPHCWRCHNPIIFRATEQWFISMERKLRRRNAARARARRDQESEVGPGLGRGAHLEHGRDASRLVHLAPAHLGRAHRGVPCEGCKEFVGDPASSSSWSSSCSRAKAPTPGTSTTPNRSCPPGPSARSAAGTTFRKEMDIIDVWFESGSSHAAVLGHEPGTSLARRLYLEGGDQHRGWFQSSLLCAVGTQGRSAVPRSVRPHGWTLDPQGRAHVESLGNTVDPVEIADKMGARDHPPVGGARSTSAKTWWHRTS